MEMEERMMTDGGCRSGGWPSEGNRVVAGSVLMVFGGYIEVENR